MGGFLIGGSLIGGFLWKTCRCALRRFYFSTLSSDDFCRGEPTVPK